MRELYSFICLILLAFSPCGICFNLTIDDFVKNTLGVKRYKIDDEKANKNYNKLKKIMNDSSVDLNTDEYKIIRSWTSYASAFYRSSVVSMNEYAPKKEPLEVARKVSALNSAIDKLPDLPPGNTVYSVKSVELNPEGKFPIGKDDYINLSAPFSTTLCWEQLCLFTRTYKKNFTIEEKDHALTVYKVNHANGKVIASLSSYTKEGEVLVKPGESYRVIALEEKDKQMPDTTVTRKICFVTLEPYHGRLDKESNIFDQYGRRLTDEEIDNANAGKGFS